MHHPKLVGKWVALFLVIVIPWTLSEAGAVEAHSGLTWKGTQTCIPCHAKEVTEVFASSHYQWEGQALYSVNGPDIQGKIRTAFNSYCISILGNWNACGTCHVGLGATPESTLSETQSRNIDCLICHQSEYKRTRVDGVFVPDTANMNITMDQAVQTVHKPTRTNCLQCHAKGGGGDNYKRGDLALAHAKTGDINFDVHMATTGEDLNCQKCHTTQNHRIAGRGSDLRQTDLDLPMSCSTSACHADKKTKSGHDSETIDRHVARVACQTCHIPAYARNAVDTSASEATETYRDWTVPEWSDSLKRWEPLITKKGDLKPVYRFWNGYNQHYSLNETAFPEPTEGTYPTSTLEGGIQYTGSILYPFKYKKSLQPLSDSLGMLIALDTSVYFSTGDYHRAVEAGLGNMGHPETSGYRNVETDTHQLITHEVMPKENALSCNACHTSTATQMDLKSMGYVIKGTAGTTCVQCHNSKKTVSYVSLHDKHVKDKKYDCSWCHSFARPERGLQMPPDSRPELVISPVARSVSAKSGNTTFGVFNSGPFIDWSVQVIAGEDWFHITNGDQGTNAGVVVGSYEANESSSVRTARIRVTASGAAGSPMEITVEQAGSGNRIGAEAGFIQRSLSSQEIIELMINSSNRHGDTPIYEWFLFTAVMGGRQLPVYLLSASGIVELNQVYPELSRYTFPFDPSGVTVVGRFSLSQLGLKAGDTFAYAYAYQNQAQAIVLDNLVLITVN